MAVAKRVSKKASPRQRARWSLIVSYPLDVYGDTSDELDRRIAKAVGKRCAGSGGGLLEGGLRDASFNFPSEADARAAARRVQKLRVSRLYTYATALESKDPPGKTVVVVEYPEARVQALEPRIVALVGSAPADALFPLGGDRMIRWLFDDKEAGEAVASRIRRRWRVTVRTFVTRG
jgi:hypothetical protein